MCAAVHDFVNPIAERHGVQLVLAGHEHGYERTAPLTANRPADPGRGTVYMITGGGGGELHVVNPGGLTETALQVYHYLRVDAVGGALTLRAIGLDGAEIERYVIRPKPVVRERGVMSIGDYGQSIAAGSLASIFGANLATESRSASETPAPLEMGGTRVKIGGRDVPLLFASPGQINAQIPYDADPGCLLEIVTPNGSAQATLSLRPTAPSIIAVTYAGNPATPSNAPSAGDAVIVYATGLGPCGQAAVADGSGGVTARTVTPVAVLLDSMEVQPTFAGMAAGFDGLNQVNFTIPNGMAGGTHPLRIATPDGSSRIVQLTVR